MLSIIIVNYKTPKLLSDCLTTIVNATRDISYEIIVADNYSNDNSEDIILSQFPFVKWIQMSYNAGFARANNEAIRQSKGDVVLLLNSDTLNTNNAVELCYKEFASSNYVACGVQLLNKDGSPQISGNYVMRGGLNYLLPLPYLGNIVRWLGYRLNVKKTNVPDAKNEEEVDWINGAFLMVKKRATEQAGLMDEDFFLYAEEAEWCGRLKKFGKLCIYGQFNVIHLQGETANQTFGSSGRGYYNLYDRKGLQIMLSNFVRIRKQFGLFWFLVQLLLYSVSVPLYFFLSFFDNLFHLRNPFADFLPAYKFLKNVSSLWRFTPTIVANKPYFYKVL